MASSAFALKLPTIFQDNCKRLMGWHVIKKNITPWSLLMTQAFIPEAHVYQTPRRGGLFVFAMLPLYWEQKGSDRFSALQPIKNRNIRHRPSQIFQGRIQNEWKGIIFVWQNAFCACRERMTRQSVMTHLLKGDDARMPFYHHHHQEGIKTRHFGSTEASFATHKKSRKSFTDFCRNVILINW